MKAKWHEYPSFIESEFDCQETGENNMTHEFMLALQNLRIAYGKPMKITSGYRSPDHSIESKKEKPGKHSEGIACDIAAHGPDKYRLVQLAIARGFTGVGVDKHFIHLDTRKGNPAIWGY